jgi:hypothetical protein
MKRIDMLTFSVCPLGARAGVAVAAADAAAASGGSPRW